MKKINANTDNRITSATIANDITIYNDKFQNHLHKYKGIIISDPPYNQKFDYNSYKDNLSDKEYVELISNFRNYPAVLIHYPVKARKFYDQAMGTDNLTKVISWCYSALRQSQHRDISFYNCKPNMGAVRRPYKNPTDKRIKAKIAAGSEGAILNDYWLDIPQVNNKSIERGIHPCPVPLKLMERIILITTNPNDLIIEPFLGSGTTVLACLNTGRRCVAFEVDPLYYNEAKSRIAAHPKILKPFIQAA